MVFNRPAKTKSTDPHRPLQWKRQYPLHSRPLPSLSFPFFKTSNVHKQLHSDVKNKQKKNSWVLFLTAASTEGFVTDPSPWALQAKTIAAAGSMHICHARRIGGPDGCDTVAGASTNVCGCPCCYLYHGETWTHKYLQKDSETLFCSESKWSTTQTDGIKHYGSLVSELCFIQKERKKAF